jgi:phosphatidate cytidylyltransferase
VGVTTRRVLVALIVLPGLYAVIRYAPPMGFFALVAAAVIIGQREFCRLFDPEASPWRLALGLGLAGFVVWRVSQMAAAHPGGVELTSMAVLAGGVAAVLLIELFTGQQLATALPVWGLWLFGAFYLGGMLGHLVLLRALEQGSAAVLFVVTVTWMVDSAAYFGGRRFGRHALSPMISPRKTVEGWWLPELSWVESLGAGLLLGCIGQLGDLAESMFKRRASVKDSGGWIPGHGGLLDKVDSLVFTAPTFYYYLLWVRNL